MEVGQTVQLLGLPGRYTLQAVTPLGRYLLRAEDGPSFEVGPRALLASAQRGPAAHRAEAA